MIYLIFPFLILIISNFLSFLKSEKINYLFSIVFFLILTINIKYTADWLNYESIFNDSTRETKDFFIKYISILFSEWGLEYHNVYQFHIVCISIILTNFISKFYKNPFLILLSFLFISYIPLVNQIRYFLAFSIYLFAIYNFYLKDYKLFFVFTVLSIVNHIGIIPLYLILLFVNKDIKVWKLFILSFIVYFVMKTIMNISYVSHLGGFNIYIKDEMRSSLLGGILKILPSLFFIGMLLILNKNNKNSSTSTFLYRLSIFPIIFLPSSTLTQIIGDRYVFIFSIVWILYIYKTIMAIKLPNQKLINIYKFLIVLTFIWFIIYLLPLYLFGESHLYNELIKTIDSQF